MSFIPFGQSTASSMVLQASKLSFSVKVSKMHSILTPLSYSPLIKLLGKVINSVTFKISLKTSKNNQKYYIKILLAKKKYYLRVVRKVNALYE